jgi:Flp pilus assembly protein TadD
MVMFKANLELFPNSWNAYDSLAEACLKAGDRQKASELYSKSVELNPNNKNGKDALDKLRQSGS